MSQRTIYEAPRVTGRPDALTEDRASPSGPSIYNTCLVEVEPWTER